MSRKRLAILLSLVCLFTSMLPVQMVFGKEVTNTNYTLIEDVEQRITNEQIEVEGSQITTGGQIGVGGDETTTGGQIEVDPSGLVNLITVAEELLDVAMPGTTPGCYDILDIAKFELAIAEAKEVAKDAQTQSDIEAAIAKLDKAIEIFENSKIVDQQKLDFSKLEKVIEEAEKLYRETQVGSAIGNVTTSTQIRLSIGIMEAKKSAESAKTQNDINQAQLALEEAIRVFKAAMIKPEDEDANADGTINVADLALVAYYFGAQKNDANWEQAKCADVNRDGEVNTLDLSILAQKILSK